MLIRFVKKLPYKRPRYGVLYIHKQNAYIWVKDMSEYHKAIKFVKDNGLNPNDVYFFVKDEPSELDFGEY